MKVMGVEVDRLGRVAEVPPRHRAVEGTGETRAGGQVRAEDVGEVGIGRHRIDCHTCAAAIAALGCCVSEDAASDSERSDVGSHALPPFDPSPQARARAGPDRLDHRFGAAARAQGAIEAHTFKDARSDALVGLAIWGSDDDLAAARPALSAAVEGDDFDTWESGPVELFLLHDV